MCAALVLVPGTQALRVTGGYIQGIIYSLASSVEREFYNLQQSRHRPRIDGHLISLTHMTNVVLEKKTNYNCVNRKRWFLNYVVKRENTSFVSFSNLFPLSMVS